MKVVSPRLCTANFLGVEYKFISELVERHDIIYIGARPESMHYHRFNSWEIYMEL